MKTTKQTVMMPQFAETFQCVGGACIDTCCRTWDVSVDKKTFQKYYAVEDEGWREEFRKYVHRWQENSNYGKINMLENGHCPFWTEDGRCGVQLAFGEEYLCVTCNVYPKRYSQTSNEHYQIAMTPSCPEVIYAGLLSKEPMQFVQREANFPVDLYAASRTKMDGNSAEILLRVRQYMIELMQNRDYAIEERFFLLGFFLQKLPHPWSKYADTAISSFKRLILDPSLIKEQLKELPVLEELHFELLELYLKLLVETKSRGVFAELIGDVFDGFDPGAKESGKFTMRQEKYFEVRKQYKKAAPQWEHVFENYFANNIFSFMPEVLFYTHKDDDKNILWTEYIKLCLSYLLLNIHFSGIYANFGKLTEQDIVRIIYLFSRSVFDHDKSFIKTSSQFLEKSERNSLAHLYSIINI